MSEAETDLRWIRIQAASGLTFSLFLVLHLVSTMFASGGEEAFDGFRDGARAFYQTAIFEVIVVAIPLLTHMTASAVRIVRRRRGARKSKAALRTRLHRWSGWFLLAVIGGHVAATRLVPLATDTQVGFGDLNFTTIFFGLPFAVYYMLLGICGTYHMSNGLLIAARVFGLRAPEALRMGPGFWLPVGAAMVAVVIGVASFSGWIFDVDSASWGPASELLVEFYDSDLESFAPER
jgi:succinate dehydrogenase/fumarate reductase cytochrome b subunit